MSATGQPDPDLPATSEVEGPAVRGLALLVRLALEVALLVGAAWSAWTAADGAWWRWPATVMAPIVIGVAWAAWLSPRARRRPAEPVRFGIEALLFGVVGAWLWGHGHPWLGVTLVGAWAVDRAVIATTARRR
ncbi:YrdB family protein [Xylanimonas ulmi]|uniref:Uncharacterized protein DUF2568 n=1 Tax=Xylanimonas ulmi TaxID=228973 RepID=A0A4Q7M2P8_9MICO|nr:YrdB family protein [Xylanibacterium ulmi]RZS61117.1 uncharacterized protein DUF2568 [Xylanibacterium ulmi]